MEKSSPHPHLTQSGEGGQQVGGPSELWDPKEPGLQGRKSLTSTVPTGIGSIAGL